MKLLLIIVLTVAALYAAYWVVVSRNLDRGLRTGIAAAEAQGWTITTSDLSTQGFPSRFDIAAADLVVTAPGGALTWTAPWLRTAALSYQPNRVIVTLPPRQQIQLQRQQLTLDSTGLRASLGVAANRTLALSALTAEAQSLSIGSDLGWTMASGAALFALRPQAAVDATYDVYLGLADLRPGLDLPSAPAGPAQLTVDAVVTLDRPLDRTGMGAARPAITAVALSDVTMTWGDLALTGRGTLTVDQTGTPTGQVSLTVTGWQDAIGLLAEAGIIQPGVMPTLTQMAGMMARADGTLPLPITFRNGNMALGPLPLGPAPRLRLP